MQPARAISQEKPARLRPSPTLRGVLATLGPLALISPLMFGWTGVVSELAFALPLKCPLHAATGILCPTCGLGRALFAAVLGDWSLAWRYHPLGPPLWLLLGLGSSLWALAPSTLGQLLAPLTSLARRQRRWLVAMLVLYAAWGFLWRSRCNAEGDMSGLCYPGSLAAAEAAQALP